MIIVTYSFQYKMTAHYVEAGVFIPLEEPVNREDWDSVNANIHYKIPITAAVAPDAGLGDVSMKEITTVL